jgi:hypothetical protein
MADMGESERALPSTTDIPWTKQGFVDLNATFNINCQHFDEKSQHDVSDVVPVWRRIIETTQSDPLK